MQQDLINYTSDAALGRRKLLKRI